jgi:hypothetical protein
MKNHLLSSDEIKPGQYWVAKGENGKIIRRIKILAKYPPPDVNSYWVIEEVEGGRMRLGIGEVRKIPEYNLRYVFELEKESGNHP